MTDKTRANLAKRMARREAKTRIRNAINREKVSYIVDPYGSTKTRAEERNRLFIDEEILLELIEKGPQMRDVLSDRFCIGRTQMLRRLNGLMDLNVVETREIPTEARRRPGVYYVAVINLKGERV